MRDQLTNIVKTLDSINEGLDTLLLGVKEVKADMIEVSGSLKELNQ